MKYRKKHPLYVTNAAQLEFDLYYKMGNGEYSLWAKKGDYLSIPQNDRQYILAHNREDFERLYELDE